MYSAVAHDAVEAEATTSIVAAMNLQGGTLDTSQQRTVRGSRTKWCGKLPLQKEYHKARVVFLDLEAQLLENGVSFDGAESGARQSCPRLQLRC